MKNDSRYFKSGQLFGGKEPKRFILMAALLIVGILVVFSYLKQNYRFGAPLQAAACIPGSFFVTSLNNKELFRDKIYRFRAKGIDQLIPNEEWRAYFADGTPIVKFLRGLPGDTVKIDESGVFVAGIKVAEGLALYKTLGASSPEEFYREYVLGPDEYFFAGTSHDSYDSRYWGFDHPVKLDQIVGRTYVLIM